jgi:hypothetical protein
VPPEPAANLYIVLSTYRRVETKFDNGVDPMTLGSSSG